MIEHTPVTTKVYEDLDLIFQIETAQFFSSKDVKKALPYLKREDRIWFLIYYHDDLAALAALFLGQSYAELKHVYVYPKYRHKGLHYHLIVERIKYAKERGYRRIKCTSNSRKVIRRFEELGFNKTGSKGSYTTLEVIL